MFSVKIIVLCLLFCPVLKAQLEGGALGLLKPEGIQLSLSGLLGLGGKKTTTTTTTTTTEATTTEGSQATTKKNKKTESPCLLTQTKANGKKSCKDKLIFQENFGKLAEKKWLIENKFAGDPDYEFVIYQNNPETVYTKKNLLHIQPSLTEDKYGKGYVSGDKELNLGDTCTGILKSQDCVQKSRAWQILPPAISGQISTKNHFSFVYGIVEIRAKLPKGDWLYPIIYLKPKSDYYGSGLDSGIIKIAFAPGNSDLSRNLTGGVVLGMSRFARTYGIRNIHSENRWNRNFHTFRLEWTTDEISVSVDDQVYGNIKPPNHSFASEQQNLGVNIETAERWQRGSKLAPFDKEMYIILGVGVGGQSFEESENKPWNNNDPKAQLNFYRKQDVWSKTWSEDSALIVDYVKVWAL